MDVICNNVDFVRVGLAADFVGCLLDCFLVFIDVGLVSWCRFMVKMDGLLSRQIVTRS